MKRFAIVIMALGLVWITGRAIYGLGYRNGVLNATQETSDELLIACEQKIDQMEDICTDAIADAVARAQEQGRQEILEQF